MHGTTHGLSCTEKRRTVSHARKKDARSLMHGKKTHGLVARTGCKQLAIRAEAAAHYATGVAVQRAQPIAVGNGINPDCLVVRACGEESVVTAECHTVNCVLVSSQRRNAPTIDGAPQAAAQETLARRHWTLARRHWQVDI